MNVSANVFDKFLCRVHSSKAFEKTRICISAVHASEHLTILPKHTMLTGKMATRTWLATDSGRVARAKDFCFVAKFLGTAKERGSTETSEDLSGPNS